MRMRKMVLLKLSPADSTTETLIYTLLGLNTEDLTDSELNLHWERFKKTFLLIHDDGRNVTIYGRW